MNQEKSRYRARLLYICCVVLVAVVAGVASMNKLDRMQLNCVCFIMIDQPSMQHKTALLHAKRS